MSWLLVTAAGGAAIAGVTLLAAIYLLYFLLGRGRGKLRVQLLIGIVTSDIVIGLVALPAEAMFVAGVPIQTGTRGCDAQAWVYTTTLFSQNLWTLAVAVATFMLLKHPLHPMTTAMERWSWLSWPIVWGVSILHSGIWYATIGFANTGSLCYYGSTSSHPGLDRDLVQFVPRAAVFIVIVILYSSLFSFLRRPDTIQLSSQLGGSSAHGQSRISFAKLARAPAALSCVRSPEMPEHNPQAPWEDLSFCNIAQYAAQSTSEGSAVVHSPIRSVPTTEPTTPTTMVGHNYMSDKYSPTKSYDRKGSVPISVISELPRPVSAVTSIHCPTHSIGNSTAFNGDFSISGHGADVEAGGEETGPSLKEFFLENQVTTDTPVPTRQMSATAYFNRQASLLMLWFPLAYMLVFSVSLVRLVVDMVRKGSSPFLSLLSSWMVLSVGIIDAVVFGLAEAYVRRKVRRQMPDRMG